METFVKVAARCRPVTSEEVESNEEMSVEVRGQHVALYKPKTGEPTVCHLDFCFDDSATQEEIFRSLGRTHVETSVQGINSALILHGTSRTGKRYTLYGTENDPGIFPRLVQDLFTELSENGSDYRVYFSCWEMNDQKIFDLLSSEDKELRIRRHPEMGFFIQHLSRSEVDYEGLIMLAGRAVERMERNEKRRGIRWHMFMQIELELLDEIKPEIILSSKFLLINLKGSEKSSGEEDPALVREGASIRKSLSSLSHVIQMLGATGKVYSSPTKPTVDYSKLTTLLREVLCGNCVTTLLACLSPVSKDYFETLDILETLGRARRLKTQPRRVEVLTEYGMMQKGIQTLKERIPSTRLADGHPLTEEEEKLLVLEKEFENTFQIEEDEFGGEEETNIMEWDQTEPRPPIESTEIPESGPLWRKNDTLAQKHGDRATVFAPSKGGAGRKYKGQWQGNQKSGQGTEISKKFKYEGQWLDGQRHGQGVLYRRRGGKWIREYKGGWFQGKREGLGILYFDSGDIYQGEFREGQLDGSGTYFYENGDKYDGEWLMGKQNGLGTYVKENGDYYEGEWKDGCKHGAGSFVYVSKGQRYDGEWVKDIAKCGVIGTLDENSAYFPRIELKDPGKVLQQEIEKLAQ